VRKAFLGVNIPDTHKVEVEGWAFLPMQRGHTRRSDVVCLQCFGWLVSHYKGLHDGGDATLRCHYCSNLFVFSASERPVRGESEAGEESAEGVEQMEQARRAKQDRVVGEHSQLPWQRLPGDGRLQQGSQSPHDRL